MRLLIAFILLPFFSFGQCVVTSITFGDVGECDPVTNSFKVPVTVNYTGTPEKVLIQIFDADYSYTPQEFSNVPFQTFTFVVYNDSNGGNGTFSVKALLQGGNCSDQSLTQPYAYSAPSACNSTCPETLALTGALATDETYLASQTIESDQTIDGKDVTMGAFQSVTLKAGFSYKPAAGKSLLVNTTGCNE